MNLNRLAEKMGVTSSSLYLRAKRGLLPLDEEGNISKEDAYFLISGVTMKRAERILGKSRSEVQSDCIMGNLKVKRFGRKFYIILPKGYYYSASHEIYFFHDPEQGWIQVSDVPKGKYRIFQRTPSFKDLKIQG